MPKEKVKQFGSQTVFGRAAQPVELAPIFVFLASDQASYVTGEVYGATGGQMDFTIAQAILPNLTADLLKLTTRLLPRMPFQAGNQAYTGWESESTLSPSLLTRIADRATGFYNGLRKYPPSR
jgi:hypothetical protein